MRRNILALSLRRRAGRCGLAGGYWLADDIGCARQIADVTRRLRSLSTAPARSPSTAQQIDPKTGRKVLYWHDPMVPGPRFDKPGKSPSWTCSSCPSMPTKRPTKARCASARARCRTWAFASPRSKHGAARHGLLGRGRGHHRRAQHHRGPVARQRLRREALRPGAVRRCDQGSAASRDLRARLAVRAGGVPRA